MDFSWRRRDLGRVRWVHEAVVCQAYKLEIWAQIHDFPDGYVSQIPSLVAKIGELVYAETASHDFE